MDNDKDAGLGKQAEPIEDTARVRAKSIDDGASQHDTQPHPQAGPSAKDEDWLHSRTSRLLDLEDENRNEDALASEQRPDNEQQGGGEAVLRQPSTDASSQSGVKDGLAPEITEASPPTQADKVHGAARLFVRNISYTATEDDIRAHFETVAQGFIDEVGHFLSIPCGAKSLMNTLIGTSDMPYDVTRNSILVDTLVSETDFNARC